MSQVLYSISQQTEDISRTLSDVPIRLFLGFQQDVIHKGTSVQVPVWSQCNVIVRFFLCPLGNFMNRFLFGSGNRELNKTSTGPWRNVLTTMSWCSREVLRTHFFLQYKCGKLYRNKNRKIYGKIFCFTFDISVQHTDTYTPALPWMTKKESRKAMNDGGNGILPKWSFPFSSRKTNTESHCYIWPTGYSSSGVFTSCLGWVGTILIQRWYNQNTTLG